MTGSVLVYILRFLFGLESGSVCLIWSFSLFALYGYIISVKCVSKQYTLLWSIIM